MKILVVDDASFMRSRAVRILQNEDNHQVIEAANGREALEAWEAESPDVILLDISMPEIDGLETLKRIRKTDTATRIVMVSALGQEPIIIEALQNGADYFLTKPYEEEHLLHALQNAFKKSG